MIIFLLGDLSEKFLAGSAKKVFRNISRKDRKV